MIEIEVYAILDEKVHEKKRNSYNRYPFFPTIPPDVEVRYRSVISYMPRFPFLNKVVNKKVETVRLSSHKYCETIIPGELFDNYHKKVPYRNGVMFDGGRLKRHKYEERDFLNIDSLVKLHIIYEKDEINFDPKTHYIDSIEIQRFAMTHGFSQLFSTQTFKIVDKEDYSKYDCFKHYTITL